jgi:PAS domain S-box-containing protein
MSRAHENSQGTVPLRALVEAAPESVLLIDKSGRILLANAWAVGAFGYSRMQLVGRKAEDLIVSRFRGKYRHTLHGTFARPPQKSEKHIPLTGRKKNGKEFPIELSLDVVNLGGDKLGILVICDVTERARMEEELRKAHDKLSKGVREQTRELSLANRKLQREIIARRRREEDLLFARDIVRSSDVAIIGRKLDGTVLSWNPAARRMFGYSAKEMIGRSIFTLVPPERMAQSRKMMATIRRGERLEHIEAEAMRKDGTRFPFVVTVSPVRNQEGKLVGASVIARDVTQRKRADALIRYQRDLAQRYLDIAEVIILVLDRRGRIVRVNRKGCEVLGYGNEQRELLRRDWFSTCIPRAYRRKARESFGRRLTQKSEGPWSYECPVRTLSGQERMVAWHSRILRDEDGRVIGNLLSGEDITERRAAEEALRQFPGLLLQARDEERRRIARELHDSTAQRLALLITQLGRAQRLGPPSNGNYTRLLRDARAIAGQALREVRSLSYLLHPPLLEEMGLASALRVYIAGLQKHHNLQIDLGITGRLERFPRNIELCAFRVVQEALTNVLRHSRSHSARVKLLREPDSLVVKVIDYGRGLSRGNGPGRAATGGRKGLGLVGMRERLSLVNGRLDIRSGRSGTTVTAFIPVSGKIREEDTSTLRRRSRRSAPRHS